MEEGVFPEDRSVCPRRRTRQQRGLHPAPGGAAALLQGLGGSPAPLRWRVHGGRRHKMSRWPWGRAGVHRAAQSPAPAQGSSRANARRCQWEARSWGGKEALVRGCCGAAREGTSPGAAPHLPARSSWPRLGSVAIRRVSRGLGLPHGLGGRREATEEESGSGRWGRGPASLPWVRSRAGPGAAAPGTGRGAAAGLRCCGRAPCLPGQEHRSK